MASAEEKSAEQMTRREIVRLRVNETAGTPTEMDAQVVTDLVANERPVNIEVNGQSVAVVMALPGEEEELAAGFALGERLIGRKEDLLLLRACEPEAPPDRQGDASQWPVRVKIVISAANAPEKPLPVMVRYACGAVGEAAFAQPEKQLPLGFTVAVGALRGLLGKFTARQTVFRATGCTHAAALFDAAGELLALKEDIGRHNAIDRVLGWALLNDVSLSDKLLVTTGRASADLAFKALSAGVPILASLSAPTALAVEWARRGGLTLIGFLRPRKINIYAWPERIAR